MLEGSEGSWGFSFLMRFACFSLMRFSFSLVVGGGDSLRRSLVEGSSCSGHRADTGWLVEMGKGSPWLSKVTRASTKSVSSRASSDHDEWVVAAAAGDLEELEVALAGVASCGGFCGLQEVRGSF
ncbi:hypothetical protein UPYG_G00305790 [Umbra pygmaea]|uniref:Secreted protein n=1 Tax=Umbra pygmaea TaxID=75934 RepID=A0ABD0VYR7_UMBPY